MSQSIVNVEVDEFPEYDDSALQAKDLVGDDLVVRKIDFDQYLERRKDKVTSCMYCRKEDLYINGKLSITSKNNISDRREPPVWFCCELCANMYKHETGLVPMDVNIFKDTFKRCYPAMYKKRYSV